MRHAPREGARDTAAHMHRSIAYWRQSGSAHLAAVLLVLPLHAYQALPHLLLPAVLQQEPGDVWERRGHVGTASRSRQRRLQLQLQKWEWGEFC